MSLSTHVLDTSRGRPAAGVPVTLYRQDGTRLTDAVTDADGRVRDLPVDGPGGYRLVFATGDYLGADAFYPEVSVAFRIGAPDEHYHVPLLLSPFGYSTYRGS